MELIIIRHGLPERRSDTADPPLTPAGRDQAERAARALSTERIDAVYSSPMLRAVQTAEPFATLSGHVIETREGIVEFDRGTGAYVPMEELKRDDQVDLGAFQRNVVETLEHIVKTNPSRRVAVFCHGGVINVWTAHVLTMPPRLFFEPVYASIHRYLCAGSGERNLISLNERCHLA
jgi:probable phosphoglycerate mutase